MNEKLIQRQVLIYTATYKEFIAILDECERIGMLWSNGKKIPNDMNTIQIEAEYKNTFYAVIFTDANMVMWSTDKNAINNFLKNRNLTAKWIDKTKIRQNLSHLPMLITNGRHYKNIDEMLYGKE